MYDELCRIAVQRHDPCSLAAASAARYTPTTSNSVRDWHTAVSATFHLSEVESCEFSDLHINGEA
jgi:hypothetical protein